MLPTCTWRAGTTSWELGSRRLLSSLLSLFQLTTGSTRLLGQAKQNRFPETIRSTKKFQSVPEARLVPISEETQFRCTRFPLPADNKYTIRLDEKRKAEILLHQKDIEEAQNLLYRVYIEETRWRYKPDNPTGFQVVVKNGKKCLVDKFDDTAIWIGAFYEEKVVSVIRVLTRVGNLRLDIEGYEAAKKPEIQEILKQDDIVECQRSATEKQFRTLGLNCLTLAVAGEMLLSQPVSVIATSPALFFSSKGRVLDDRFDYGDGIYTTCFIYDRKDLLSMVKTIRFKLALLKSCNDEYFVKSNK